MASRGCPFACEFCSNVVFGDSYRERSPAGVVDEIEQALALGYDRIAFADDVFTLRGERVVALCDEIERRGLRFAWECLARVDGIDGATAARMRRAGCRTVFFGIESGSDEILRLMRKGITAARAREAVWAAHDAGLEVGAFFILCYPGETDDTVLETLRFAASLPLDYLGLSMPYPLPGTRLRDAARGPRHGRGAARRQPPAEPAAHVRRRLLGAEDACGHPHREGAVRAAAAARAPRPRRRPAHPGAGGGSVPAPALTPGRAARRPARRRAPGRRRPPGAPARVRRRSSASPRTPPSSRRSAAAASPGRCRSRRRRSARSRASSRDPRRCRRGAPRAWTPAAAAAR